MGEGERGGRKGSLPIWSGGPAPSTASSGEDEEVDDDDDDDDDDEEDDEGVVVRLTEASTSHQRPLPPDFMVT